MYNKLLQIDYSPIAALNRTYALAKANGNIIAIAEAEKLNLVGNQQYHVLLGHLCKEIEVSKAINHFRKAQSLSKRASDKIYLAGLIKSLEK